MMKVCWFCQSPFMHWLRRLCDYYLWFYLCPILFFCHFLYVEPSLSSKMYPTWLWCLVFLKYCWSPIASIYWQVLPLCSSRKLNCGWAFCYVFIQLWYQNNTCFMSLETFPILPFVKNSLRSTGALPLRGQYNSPANLFMPGLFFVKWLFIIASILFFIIDLLRFSKYLIRSVLLGHMCPNLIHFV